MVDPIAALAALVEAAVVATFGTDYAGIDPQVRRSDRADLQADVALGLARRAGQPPRVIAERLVAALPANELVARVEVAGAGFLNVTLRDSWLAQAANRAASDDRLAVSVTSSPERVVIDYSGPNVAKELHVGHLRSTVIGDALARVLAWRGHTVIRQNHLGDWGTPFGMLIEHFVDLGDAAQHELAMGELGRFYRAASAKFAADPQFADRARRRVVALQAGDPETLVWWRHLVALSTRYFEEIYRTLDITLTPGDVCPESFYNDRLAPLVGELETLGRAVDSDGAVCLFPAGFANRDGAPFPLMLRKSDGGYGYATTDLAAIRYRLAELRGTRLLYVVGAPQARHLAMIFTAARELGWLVPPARAEHVAFGTVVGKDGKPLRSREGHAYRLIELVQQAVARAEAIIDARANDPQARGPTLDAEQRRQAAHMIGVGAIKYADLSNDRIKDYAFDVDRMVSFEGDTAGYLQYAHARIRGILRKAETEAGPILLGDRTERALALQLLGFGNAVRDVERTLEPHRLAGYLYDLAVAFTKFYDACPILASEGELRASRLALAALTGRTLACGLGLLGIAVPERM
jgi:arginyl-tRNA synthetase